MNDQLKLSICYCIYFIMQTRSEGYHSIAGCKKVAVSVPRVCSEIPCPAAVAFFSAAHI